MFRRGLFLVLFVILFFCLSDLRAQNFFECEASQVKSMLDRVFPKVKVREGLEVPELQIVSTKDFKVDGITLCEVLYRVKFPLPEEEKSPFMVNEEKIVRIGYFLTNDVFFDGELIVKEGERVKFVTRNKFEEVNAEVLAELRQQLARQDEKEVREIEEATVEEIIKNSNVKIDVGKEVDFITFVDVHCVHCMRMIQDLITKHKDKVNVYVLFTPVLGSNSKTVSIALICNYKDDSSRLNALMKYKETKKLEKRSTCLEGENRIIQNLNYFSKLNARGVPANLLFNKKTKKLYRQDGYLPPERVEKILTELR